MISDIVCRLFGEMNAHGASTVVPELRPEDADMTLGPWVDPANVNPGYLARSMQLMPKQGDHEPWLGLQEHAVEKDDLPGADLDDGSLVYR